MSVLQKIFTYTGLVAVVFLVFAFSQGSFQKAESQPVEPPGDSNEPSFTGPRGAEFAPGRILVELKDDASAEDLKSLNGRNNARTKKEIPGLGTKVVELPDNLPVEKAVGIYEKAPFVKYAEPDYKYSPVRTPNDSLYTKQYGLNNTGQTGGKNDADIDAPQAWDETVGDPATLVAVIDTGVSINHSDLDGNIWTNTDEIAGNNIDDDNNGYVDDVNGWDFFNDDNSVYDDPETDRHGTHVAGTVAAEGNNDTGVVGVNWEASIMPLKFIGPDFVGYSSDAAAAIDYAVDNSAKISNNSWGAYGSSKTIAQAINQANNNGHLFVAAAGNNGTDNDQKPFYPASYKADNIISVAATDEADRLASFSNFGNESVDLGAPGVQILSTLPGPKYDYLSGTSMASPHVAGTAALVKAQNSTFNDDQIKRRILQSVDRIKSLGGKTVTGGRLNAARTLVTNLTLNADPETVVFRNDTVLSGRLTDGGVPLGSRQVQIQERPQGASSFRNLAEVTTDADGPYRLDGVKPSKRTYYRAKYSGNESDGIEPATSPSRRVNVRVFITLNLKQSNLELGKRRGMTGRVLPGHPGDKVRITIKRNGDVINRKEVSLNSDSHYRFVYKPPNTGRYAFYAFFPADKDHLGKRSNQKSFRVVD